MAACVRLIFLPEWAFDVVCVFVVVRVHIYTQMYLACMYTSTVCARTRARTHTHTQTHTHPLESEEKVGCMCKKQEGKRGGEIGRKRERGGKAGREGREREREREKSEREREGQKRERERESWRGKGRC